MSNTDYMLEAVLRMPPNLWSGSEIDVMQRHSRYVQAAEELATLRQQLAEAKQENEALRFYEINSLCDEVETWRQQLAEAKQEIKELREELAALKASTEPVAWECVNRVDKTIHLTRQPITSEFDDTLWKNTPLYTPPPTAAALVEDFKRRCAEECRYWGNSYAADIIESMPLIEEKK